MDDFISYHNGLNKRKWDVEDSGNYKKPRFEQKKVLQTHDTKTLEKILFPNQQVKSFSFGKLIQELSILTEQNSNLTLIFDYLNSIVLNFEDKNFESCNELFWKMLVDLSKNDEIIGTFFPSYSFSSIFKKITFSIQELVKSKTNPSQEILGDYFIEILDGHLNSLTTNQLHDNNLNIDQFLPVLVSCFRKTKSNFKQKFEKILELSLNLLKNQQEKIIEKDILYDTTIKLIDSLFQLFCK